MSENKPKILIVDDEPAIILSLDFLMKKAGYQVFLARNGAEALHLAFTEKPHLVLLDIMMPDVDGYEVCRQIRNQFNANEMSIIFLTAKSKDADVQKGLALGADHYLTKPFSTRQLLDVVKNLIKNHNLF